MQVETYYRTSKLKSEDGAHDQKRNRTPEAILSAADLAVLQLTSSQPEAAKLPTDFQSEDLRLSLCIRPVVALVYGQHVRGTMEEILSNLSASYVHTPYGMPYQHPSR